MAGKKKADGGKKGKKKSKRGKKGKRKHADLGEMAEPALPYGADPWLEQQPISLPDVSPGHTRTIFPVGLIMPSTIFDAKENLRQKAREADEQAVLEDEKWEAIYEDLRQRVREMTDSANRYHLSNRFLEDLLSSNEINTDSAIKTLSKTGMELKARVIELESKCKAMLTKRQNEQRSVDANNHETVVRLEKEVAVRDRKLGDLVLEHLDLRRLEEDRDSLQSTITELRSNVYENEKEHQKNLMQADQQRRIAQRRAQENAKAKLEELAQKGTTAALENIAHQKDQISEETAHSSGLFRWICDKVRKNRSEVEELQQVLDECILDHDAVVSACEGKVRELRKYQEKLTAFQETAGVVPGESARATLELEEDSRSIRHAIERTFYDRDKEIIHLKATVYALEIELQKTKTFVRKRNSKHHLVERFLVASLTEARTNKKRYQNVTENKAIKEYKTQLHVAWKYMANYPPFRLDKTIKVNQDLIGYSPPTIPVHEDISQLSWAEKEIVLETIFQYLGEYRSFGKAGKHEK